MTALSPSTELSRPAAASSAHPRISVVTVVRNGAGQLAQTIASVEEQTYRNIEYIVVDGNSSDGTVAVIKAHEGSIDRWISEPDDGIYDAMNKAVAMCSGDYLYFLNCADRFATPQTLEHVVKELEKVSPDILCGHVFECHEEGKILNTFRTCSEYQLYLLTVCHQALFTARGVFEKVGGFDTSYRICADREWLLRALKVHHYALSYIDLPISIFDTSGVSSRQRRRLRLENLKINYRYFNWSFYLFLIRQAGAKIGRLVACTR